MITVSYIANRHILLIEFKVPYDFVDLVPTHIIELKIGKRF